MATRCLSEHDSKRLVAGFGVPVCREELAADPEAAARAAVALGFPVALKLCAEGLAHKSERDLVRLGLADAEAVRHAGRELLGRALPSDGETRLLVAELVAGRRELLVGLVRDPELGPCVSLGLGGVLTEALGDVVFAPAPLDPAAARGLVAGLRSRRLFERPCRGEPAADLDRLAALLVALGRLGLERPDVRSVDLNPVVLCEGRPVAVDALVELDPEARPPAPALALRPAAAILERFRPLFHPRGIVVSGVSSHPGKFGFAAFHNLLRCGYQGELYPLSREGSEVLGRPTLRSPDEVPDGRADLLFLCTPHELNLELMRAAARRGVRAVFVASGGYGEAGPEGRGRERELVELADALGLVLAGPNGQGVISTAESMCAQIVAPFPPAGRISIASQSGNLVSSFLNYAVQTGVGVAQAVSAGNAAQTTLADYFEYFAEDPGSAVALGYLEGVRDGARLLAALRRVSARKPLVLVKGGASAEGKLAAASHTGSLATDDRVFDGVCRALGVLRAPSVEEAFEWAASFATQPLPRGRRTVVFTTAGGWGVLAADACAAAGLELVALPEEVRARIDRLVPARWSRGNPVDLAGGETRDTIPEVLDCLCAHPEVDAVVHLGIGIQAAQAQQFRSGPFYPGHGLERIVDFHERQDRRYARAAREASERHGKPVLTASELVHTDRAYGNAGPIGVREEGRVCYPSAQRAVSALAALCRYAEFRRRLEG